MFRHSLWTNGASRLSTTIIAFSTSFGLAGYESLAKRCGMFPTWRTSRFTGSQVNAPTYDTGETIELTATFSEPVSVNTSGAPYVPLTIGSNARRATYHAAGSSGKKLVFRYTVVSGDRDDNGISIAEDALTGDHLPRREHDGRSGDRASGRPRRP